MEKQNYNGKTALLVSYKFRTSIYDGQDIVFINTDFPTYEQALQGMKKIMPDGYEYDDGYDIKEWDDEIQKGSHYVFQRFNAQLDERHNILATLSPLK